MGERIILRLIRYVLLFRRTEALPTCDRVGSMKGSAGLADCFALKNFQNEKDTTILHFCNRLRLAFQGCGKNPCTTF